MNEKKTFGILAAMLLMLIGIVGLASAAEVNVTLTSPNSSIEFNNSVEAVIYVEADDPEFTIASCKIAGYAVDTANHTSVDVVAATSNDTMGVNSPGLNPENSSETVGGAIWNWSLDTTRLQDSENWRFTPTCDNTSGASNQSGTEVTSVQIDNTVPVTPTIEYPSEKQVIGNNTLVIKAAIGSWNITDCTFYFVGANPGSSIYTVQDSGNEYCNVSISKASENTFTIYATATDGFDTSANSPNRIFSIDTESKGGAAAAWYITESAAETAAAEQAAETGAGKDDRSTTLLLLVAIIIIVFIINKKPGK